MKPFTYSQCNNAFALTTKKEYKQHDNDKSIKAKYNSLIGDTYIAIENIEEVLNDLNELQRLKVSIENEDTSFANAILGTSNYGNNDSCYRSYLTIDGKNVIEIRIANHYETKKTALEKSNNQSQFIYQVVLITDPPKQQQGDSITTTTTTAHLKILTKGIISKDASEEELSRLLKSIHDYLISPNSEWEISKPNNPQTINCNTNMNMKQIRLTESDLKQIVKESVNKILNEAYGKSTFDFHNNDTISSDYYALVQRIEKNTNFECEIIEDGQRDIHSKSNKYSYTIILKYPITYRGEKHDALGLEDINELMTALKICHYFDESSYVEKIEGGWAISMNEFNEANVYDDKRLGRVTNTNRRSINSVSTE